MSCAGVSKFTQEELEELRAFDAELDGRPYQRRRTPLTPEEKRARNREYNRRYWAKKREQKAAGQNR